jgi:hypothetical protein
LCDNITFVSGDKRNNAKALTFFLWCERDCLSAKSSIRLAAVFGESTASAQVIPMLAESIVI